MLPWVRELGSHLSVHDKHGYLAGDMLAPTESVLKGRTVIGLYFSAEWCPPCQVFNPLLKQLHFSKQAHCNKAIRNIPPFEVVLVSQCRDARATKQYFSEMPWTVMTHAKASGKRGLALRDKFGITTIPALVLLDGEGAVLCRNAQGRLRKDPKGKHFPWQDPLATPRLPLVGFNLVDHSRLDVPRLSNPLPRPLGKPPMFAPLGPTLTQDPQYAKEAAIAHRDRGSSHSHQVLGALSAKKKDKTL
jgi:nucleoredoxin